MCMWAGKCEVPRACICYSMLAEITKSKILIVKLKDLLIINASLNFLMQRASKIFLSNCVLQFFMILKWFMGNWDCCNFTQDTLFIHSCTLKAKCSRSLHHTRVVHTNVCCVWIARTSKFIYNLYTQLKGNIFTKVDRGSA